MCESIQIFSYTTKQAVEDGVLIKINPFVSKQYGIKYPVYLTDTVYRRYVEVPEDAKDHQDLDARLFDLLCMFAMTAKQSSSSMLYFKFICLLHRGVTTQPNEKKSGLSRFHKTITLKAQITGQDIDDPTPAIFIMLPSED